MGAYMERPRCGHLMTWGASSQCGRPKDHPGDHLSRATYERQLDLQNRIRRERRAVLKGVA